MFSLIRVRRLCKILYDQTISYKMITIFKNERDPNIKYVVAS